MSCVVRWHVGQALKYFMISFLFLLFYGHFTIVLLFPFIPIFIFSILCFLYIFYKSIQYNWMWLPLFCLRSILKQGKLCSLFIFQRSTKLINSNIKRNIEKIYFLYVCINEWVHKILFCIFYKYKRTYGYTLVER